jgi:hypothetical protein
MWYN